jgi:hypothetical protein
LFGIKNARRPAREHKLVFGSRVNQLLTLRPTLRFLDHDIAFRDHFVELSGTCKRLIA